jgi:trimethylamine---corrinoid protein Co-methyltransferase
MPLKTVSLLSRESLERIHSESLKILETVGVRVENQECRSILEKAGAKRQGQSEVVRLPAPMVLEALDQITKKFELVHPTGERFWVPDVRPRVGTRVKMPKILEFGAKTCRPPRRQDVINVCRIANALPKLDFTIAIRFPSSDVPAEIDVADTMGLVFAVTGKLSKCNPETVEDARVLLDVAAAAVGSDNLDQNPGTWVEVNTTSPLVLGAREGSIILHVLGRHIPIDIAPMPVAGVATPFTLAGTLAVGNAESLFLCTLANAIWPGAKIIHSVCGSILNMKTANLSMGSAASCLLSSGELALAQFYGLPTYRCGGYSDSHYPDIQAGIEKMAATLTLAQSKADLVVMGGPLNCAAHHSYEQVVIDHDIWEMSQRIATEIEVNDATLAYDTVVKVGPGGSYIAEPHTLRWVRSGEHYYGGSFNCSGLAGEENTMLARAHQRVENILSEPFKFCAPPDALERIKQYVRDHAKLRNVTPPEWTD